MHYALEYLKQLELNCRTSLPNVYSLKGNYTKGKPDNSIYLLICQIAQHSLDAMQK